MREVLEPLALEPGVRLTSVISFDGVPVASLAGLHQRGNGESVVADLDTDADLGSAAAQAAAWLSEVTRAIGPLSWGQPERMVLRCTQGTLMLLRGPGAVLLVVLDAGLNPEDVRVPMEGAIARMHRLLRSVGASNSTPGPLPAADPSAPQGQPMHREPAGLQPNPSPTNPGQQPGTPGPFSQ